jgi:ribosomal-protein-alanine N-acetyltransferase
LEGVVVREMVREDLLEVQAIANRSFTTPWRLNSFFHELDNRDAVLKVALFNKQITGYVCLRTVLDVIHVMDIAVSSGFRHMGAGTLLLNNELRDMKRLRPETKHITLEVRESNTAAIKFYEKFGFNETGRRRGYYQKPCEDAVIMDLDMDQENSSPAFH